MKKIIKNLSGFSLLEMVVVLGIMAASATYFMSMQQNIIKSQSRFDSINDSNIMMQNIELGLIKKESCTATMETAPNGKLVDGAQLDQIVSVLADGTQREIYKFDATDGYDFSEYIRINKIELADVNTTSMGSEAIGTFRLEIYYNKAKKILEDTKEYKKKTSVMNFKALTDMTITECLSTGGGAIDVDEIIAQAVEQAKKEVCEEDGGTINPTTMLCDKPEGGLELSEIHSVSNTQKTKNLGSTEQYQMCFVTGFELDSNNKGSNPDFGCRVIKSNGFWVLHMPSEFRINKAQCDAQCLNVCTGAKDGYWKTTGYGSCEQDTADKKYYRAVYYEKVAPTCGSTKTSPAGPKRVSCTPCLSPKLICPEAGNQCVTSQQCKDAGGSGGNFK